MNTQNYSVVPSYAQSLNDNDRYSQYKKALTKRYNGVGLVLLISLFSFSFLIEIFILLAYVLGFDGYFQGYNISEDAYYVCYAVGYVIALVVPFIIAAKIYKLKIKDTVPMKKVCFPKALMIFFFGISVAIILNIPVNIVSTIADEIGFNTTLPETPFPESVFSHIFFWVTLVIIPALVEEFAFRGVIMKLLSRFGNGVAIIISAVMFGLYHANLSQFIFATAMGIMFGYIVVKTKNIWISVLIHAVNNAISGVLAELSQFCSEEILALINSGIMVLMSLLFVLSSVILLLKFKDFFNVKSIFTNTVPVYIKAKCFAKSASMIVFILITVFMIVSVSFAYA